MSNTMSREIERRAFELLPWYVNGTLEDEERELVRTQVLSSLTCRKELERLRRLQDLMRHDDAESIATDRAFESLMARIRASEAAAAPRSGPARIVHLGIAASFLVAVTAVAWWWTAVPVTTRAPYETLTTPEPSTAAGSLRVVFEPGVSEAVRRALFERHRLTPVAPPTKEGIYLLAIPEEGDTAAIVAALRQDPRVRLVTSPPLPGAP